MNEQETRPRANQRLRTRHDLLRAAARLLKTNSKPTMEEVADEAMVSRATAYRYFPNIEALLVEAPLEGETPNVNTLFGGDDAPADPVARLQHAESAMHDMAYRNGAALRVMLAHSLNRGQEDQTPKRQNRRTGIIEAALEPIKDQLGNETYARLCRSLSLVFGTEAMIVFEDVLNLDADAAADTKQWMIQVLVDAACAESDAA